MVPEDRRAAWAHLRSLAAEYRIKMHATKPRWDSECHINTRQVWVPRQLRAPIDYLVALHEFGHILSPLANQLISSNTPLERLTAAEGAAWAWAVQSAEAHLIDLMGEDDWRQVGTALVSHIKL